ncbi:supervillin-like [Euwallacea fornicatus]|uniref:supervillin-like n=1 Tax=Euwallacea fornicatus TaxID=995702 RepID=UPI00338D6AAC
MNINVQDLIASTPPEPTLTVNFNRVARPGSSNLTEDKFTFKITKTIKTTCWNIQENVLKEISSDQSRIFFDSEAYMVQWQLELICDGNKLGEELLYHWKGHRALKGYSPLPPDIEEHRPVDRIVQWSEPALFFHAFSQPIVVCLGKDVEFNAMENHLFLVRGELPEEVHLYEVPIEGKHLRSRAVFLIVLPGKRKLVYWFGALVPIEQRQNIVAKARPHTQLKQWQKSWKEFALQETEENSEGSKDLNDFLNSSDYFHLSPKKDISEFSPRCFYLNSITGNFQATEIEYPLRTQSIVAPFPFLKTHLYTANQPALFLLDNFREVWLWKGVNDSNSDELTKRFQKELELALELAEKYVREKIKLVSEGIVLRLAEAYQEPLEFKHIFPFWE